MARGILKKAKVPQREVEQGWLADAAAASTRSEASSSSAGSGRQRRRASSRSSSRSGRRTPSGRMTPGEDGRPDTSPMRPHSRGSLVQLDGSYMFFNDGGRSTATTLAAEWKRPSRTRGSSYAQLASMMHLRPFHDQMDELQDAMQDYGTATSLDPPRLSTTSQRERRPQPEMPPWKAPPKRVPGRRLPPVPRRDTECSPSRRGRSGARGKGPFRVRME